jgi:hypothetical protein
MELTLFLKRKYISNVKYKEKIPKGKTKNEYQSLLWDVIVITLYFTLNLKV